MVSVERDILMQNLSADPVVRAFAHFLFDATDARRNTGRLDERQRITVASMDALKAKDAGAFKQVYDEIGRRQINDEADWIFDDYLMFCLACGAIRFGLNPNFVQKALAQRRRIQGDSEKVVVSPLEHFLEQPERQSSSPLSVVARETAGKSSFDEATLRDAYREAVRWTAAEDSNEFRRLIAYAAIDMAFARSALLDAAPAVFAKRFRQRVTRVAQVVYWMILLAAISGWTTLAWYYVFGVGRAAELAEKIFSMSIVITPVAVFLGRKAVTGFVERILFRLWGYPLPPKKEG